MAPQKQKFYIIAHNPNTISEAEDFLKAGANALEPDVCWNKGGFYVSHGGAGSNAFTFEHALVKYLIDLRAILTDAAGRPRYDLALINFDIKTPEDFNINDFIELVHNNFSQYPICNGVAILITVSALADAPFLNQYTQSKAMVGIGIDEEKSADTVEQTFKTAQQTRFCYANGIITTFTKLGVYNTLERAVFLKAIGGGASFQLIHTWVVADESTMRDHLRQHVDGMIVNLASVVQLKKVLLEKEFVDFYELAKNGY